RRAGSIVPDSWETLYFVFTQPGVVVQSPDGVSNNAPDPYGWVGYHSSFYDAYYTDSQGLTHGQQINYPLVPFPLNTPETTALTPLTLVSSHELAEAATDPDAIDSSSYTNLQGVGDGWTTAPASPAVEIGDLCERSNLEYGSLNGYIVQAEWSNLAYWLSG